MRIDTQCSLAIWHKVLSSPERRYLLMTHFPRYDLDGITSTLAFGTLLKLVGVDNVSFYIPFSNNFYRAIQNLPEISNLLKNINCHFDNDLNLEDLSNMLYYHDLFVVLDRPSPAALISDHALREDFAALVNRMTEPANLIVIDHRDLSAVPGHIRASELCYVDNTAPSTSTMILRLLESLLSQIDPGDITSDIELVLEDVYMLIYTGLISDSMLTTSCSWTAEHTAILAQLESKIANRYDPKSIKRRSFYAKPIEYYDFVREVSKRVIEIEQGLFIAYISFYDLFVSSAYLDTFNEALFYINYEISNTYLYRQNANLFALFVELPNAIKLVYNGKCDCDLYPLHERMGAVGRSSYGYATYQDHVDAVVERLQRAYAETFLVPGILSNDRL